MGPTGGQDLPWYEQFPRRIHFFNCNEGLLAGFLCCLAENAKPANLGLCLEGGTWPSLVCGAEAVSLSLGDLEMIPLRVWD